MNISGKLKTKFPVDIAQVMQVAGRLGDEQRVRVTFVGGVVRDMLLDRSIGDADLMLEHPANPLVVALSSELNAELISHERFFTYSLILPSKKKIDIVTAREERYPSPAKLPEVKPTSIEKDLKRRDFTINAVACWLNQSNFGEVIDPYGGQADMKAKLLRVLHEKSFVDDPTRLFRAARFAGRLGFKIEPDTERWILASIKAGGPRLLSPVRLRHEFELILKERNPLPALKILQGWEALELIHTQWKGVNLSKIKFSAEPHLGDRLVAWFGLFGKGESQTMMTDLAFEKFMKTEVLSKLVQSPSTS